MKALAEPADLSVKMNGEALANPTAAGAWLTYAVDPARMRKGVNQMEFTLRGESTANLALEDLQLWVRYR